LYRIKTRTQKKATMNKSLLLLCLSLLLAMQAAAQTDYCFDFEDVPLGTQYGPASGASPGDVVFSGPGTQVSLQEIIYPDGSTGFLNAEIYGDGLGWLDNQFILLGNNSLVFDFAGIPGGVTQVCFDYFDGGGNENFSVNGSPVAILDFFSEIGQLSIPGIEIDVTVAGNTFLEQGQVCISGDIRSLLIGGQEFGLDNLCYRQAGPIANLRAEIVGCDSAGNFDILVDFDWLSPLTVIAYFDILIDGQLEAGNISQLDFPYLLQGVQPVTDALEFELTVCQHNLPDVCASVILSKDCPPGSSCVEFEGLSDSSYGSSAGTPPGTPFYTENEVSLLLIPFQSLFWTTTYGNLVVLDAAAAPAMTAASGQHLKFESINAVFDLTAYPEPVDSVTVDFYYNGGAVNLAANGANILIQNSLQPGFYALAPTATLEVAFNAPNATEGQLIFRGALQSLLLGGSGDFRLDNLCLNPQESEPEPCALSGLSIRPLPCGITGDLFVEIDFDYQGVSDSFSLFSDAGASTHAYGALPLAVGPLPPANAEVYAFFIRDLAAGQDCALSDTLHIVNCTGCGFDGLTVGYLGQNAAGQTLIEWDFTLNSTNGDNFYSVYIDDELLGRYEWSQVPWRAALPCPASNTPPLLTICSGDSSCCVSVPLAFAPPCPPSACELGELTVAAGPCNPNGVFTVNLALDSYAGTADSFALWLNGNDTGLRRPYANLPLVLSPFVAPTPELTFTIVDLDDPECRASAVLPPNNCSSDCSLDSLSLAAAPVCLPNGQYTVRIRVEGAAEGDVLTVRSTISDFSTEAVVENGLISVTLPLPPNASAPLDNLQICTAWPSTGSALCCLSLMVPLNCPGTCPLEAIELAADPQCDPNSTQYQVKLRVVGLPLGGVLTVQSTITGASATAVLLPNGLIELQLPIPPMMVDSLLVCATNATPVTAACCLTIGIDVNCPPPCTVIEDVRYEIACNDDGSIFQLRIKELLYAPLIPLNFSVFVNGEYFGPFVTTQLPVSIGPFAADSTIYEVLVTENTTNACGFFFTLSPPHCPLPCPIESAAVVGAPSCSNASGTMYQAVFAIQGAQEGDVIVVKSQLSGATANGAYANGALVVQLPNTGLGYDKVRICLLDNPSNTAATLCCIELEYDIACPPLPCPWGGIVVAPGDCQDDGSYYATLHLITPGPSLAGSFVVVSAGYQATFQFAELPVQIGPFEGDGEPRTVTVFVSNSNCSATATFLAPECSASGDCALTLNAQPRPCDGDQFKVSLQVQASNPGTLGFLVFANGQISGPFPYNQAEVLLGPFTGDGSTTYNFLVLDFENPTCFAYAEVGPVDCANACAITALVVEAFGCNDDGSYNLAIDLQAENPSSDVLQVFTADGTLVGGYSLDSLPIIVTGFPASSGPIGRLKACILGSSPDCCAVAEFALPDCSPQDSSCVGFEPFAGFISPPNNGGQGRVPLGTESGVDIDYFIADFCNCIVKVVDAATVPFFAAGNGQVLEFQQASLYFEFPATAQEVSFDYASMPGTTGILLNINDSTSLGILLDTLPLGQTILLPNGNTIKRTLSPNSSPNANSFRIIIQGAIDELALWGAGFLDNLCYELTDQEVWPGDANADNIANHIDLLSVGLAYGAQGASRFEDSDAWDGFFAEDWPQFFADGLNYKHADCNGDGTVDVSDRNVIAQNYGLTHGPVNAPTALPGTDLDPPIFVNFPPQMPNGANFNVPIIIGSAAVPVQDVYGIAFTVEFDPQVIDPGAIQVVYPTSWFGQPDVNTLYIDRTYAAEGKIEIALTRIDQNNVSGFGPVAYIIGIIDDIAGLIKTEVAVTQVVAIRNDEQRLPLSAPVQRFELIHKEEPLPDDPELARGMFSVFPNPTADWVSVASRHGFAIDELRLLNASGALLPALQEGRDRISLEGLPAGVYILRIRSGDTLVHKKVVKY
jgi:hypothetical protein